jgi:hypothetical protein
LNSDIKLHVDANFVGVGAVLLCHGNLLLWHGQNNSWSQMERSLFAVYFGTTTFQDYIYGCPKTVIESDHNYLENICKKDLLKTLT